MTPKRNTPQTAQRPIVVRSLSGARYPENQPVSMRLSSLLSRFAGSSRALDLAALCGRPSPPPSAQPFPQPTVIPTGNWPAAVSSADINADGNPDLIYIDQ